MSLLEDERKLSDCLNRLKYSAEKVIAEDEEFQYFHSIRNRFNDTQVIKLVEQAPYNPVSPIFKDNLNRLWREESIGVAYHVDKWSINPIKIVADNGQTLRKWGRDKKNRFARKFLMVAQLPG